MHVYPHEVNHLYSSKNPSSSREVAMTPDNLLANRFLYKRNVRNLMKRTNDDIEFMKGEESDPFQSFWLY